MKNSYKDRFKIAYVVLLILAASFFSSWVYLKSCDTLYSHHQWVSSKILLKRSVMGDYGFIGFSNSLAGNNLDLSKWFGFQEVIYRDSVDPVQIDFDYLLGNDAYLIFVFNKDRNGFSGIRISVNALFSNIYFTSDEDGGFLTTAKMPSPDIQTDKWNHCKVVFGDNSFSIFMNGTFVGKYQAQLLKGQQIGFRGGQNTARIHDVSIRVKGSGQVIKETFDHKDPMAVVLIFIGFFTVNIGILVFYLLRSMAMDKALLRLEIFNLLLVILFSFYALMLSRYPKNEIFMDRGLKAEKGGAKQDFGKKFIVKKIADKYRYEDAKNSFRILFVGTSQTWGAGASEESKTFVSRIEEGLNEEDSGQVRYQCINAGISGVNSTDLLDLYEKQWVRYKPKITVVVLSNNDTDITKFVSNLEEFIKVGRDNGIRTVFVLEANEIENTYYVDRNHALMKKIAIEQNIPLIDLHGYLIKNYDKGFLWWDHVHLTNFGQKLAGDYILGELKDKKLLQGFDLN